MQGMMMDVPLLVSTILKHAENYHSDAEIVSGTVEGGIHRYTYSDLSERAGKLALALESYDLASGDRVGTLAWSDYRHLELYYGVSGSGLVCHTINPRLHQDQISFIIEHANDRIIFADPAFVPLLEALADRLAGLEAVVILTEPDKMPTSEILPGLLCYETLIAAQSGTYDWPPLDENAAAGLCYTSGTTGNPKGVLYSHRSIVLHAMMSCSPDVLDLSARDVACPLVPMFHVNAWGIPYAAPMVGAKLVLPGPRMDGESLTKLLNDQGVTFSAGVPTVWLGLLDWMDSGDGLTFNGLNRVVIGGSAVPKALIDRFNRRLVTVRHAWGMTETSPIGLASTLTYKHNDMTDDEKAVLEAKQGRPVFGMEFRVVGADGQPVPWDGKSFGAMLVRGPWVAAGYYNAAESAVHANGWFDTGDVVTMDANGFVQIVDRSKDVIKSGGEWISSIDLENIAQAHPAIREAAVVARSDHKWGERPVLVVQLTPGAGFDTGDMYALFEGKIPKWSMPEDLIVLDELPHTATGKLLKMAIRDIVANKLS